MNNSDETQKEGVVSVVIDFLTTFVTALIVIIAVLLVVLKLLGWNLYSVDSYSMTPAYPINSLIVVQNVEPETIRVGDVITYVLNADGVLVTHRVTAIDQKNETFTTKGDANETEDASPVLWVNMVGKVVMGFPYMGAPFRYLTDQNNRPLVIGVIAAVLLLSFAVDPLISAIWGKNKEAMKSDSEEQLEEWPESSYGEYEFEEWQEPSAEEYGTDCWDDQEEYNFESQESLYGLNENFADLQEQMDECKYGELEIIDVNGPEWDEDDYEESK